MRIVHFEKYLEASRKQLILNLSSARNPQGVEFHTISNWESVCNTLHGLVKLDFIKPLVIPIFELGLHFESPTLTLKLDATSFNRFSALHTQLIMALDAMLSMSAAFFPKDDENQLNIRLPDKMSLSEMSGYLTDIDLIFNKMQAMRKINDNNEFTLKRVDAGSVWLILFVAVPTAVAIIGSIVKLSMDVKRRLLDDEIVKQKLRVLKSGANAIEQIEKELSETLKLDCAEKAKVFCEENSLELDKEELLTLSTGIERLGHLLYKGVEIYASIEAPDSVSGAFPVQESASLLEAARLQLPLPESAEDK